MSEVPMQSLTNQLSNVASASLVVEIGALCVTRCVVYPPSDCYVYLEKGFGLSVTVDAVITRVRSWYPTGQSFTQLSLFDLKIGQ